MDGSRLVDPAAYADHGHGFEEERRVTAGTEMGGSGRIFDHHEMRRSLRGASQAIDAILAEPSPSVPAARAALHAIEGLESVLVAHFRYEEGESGFFAELLGIAPQLTKDLDELRRQHPGLAERMSAVVEDARWAGLSGSAWRRVSAGFGSFAQELKRHERAEDALVADALFTDEGGSG